MGSVDVIDIHWPMLMLSRQFGFQNQAPYSCADCENVRVQDVFQERLRGGSRPGLAQVLPPKTVEIGDEPDGESFGPLDVYPTKDTYLDANLDTSPQGTSVSMRIGRAGAVNRWRPVLHYDLYTGTGLDSGSIVSLAELTVRIGATNTIGSFTVVVNRLTTTNWVEAECTWNRASTATDWATGDGSDGTDGGDYTATGAISVTWPSTTSGLFTMDITTLAQDAVTTRSGQLHILMKLSDDTSPGPGGSGEQANFGSRTAANPDHYPKLTISGTL